MAVFYKHIKGTSNAVSNSRGLWTWLKWSNENFPEDSTVSKTDAKFLPHIHINEGNTDPGNANDLGYVLTSDAKGQTINQPFRIEDLSVLKLNISEGSNLEQKDGVIEYTYDGETHLNIHATSDYLDINNESGQLNISAQSDALNLFSDFKTSIITHEYVRVGANDTDEPIILDPKDGKVQAVYFNATSDKRAKENIHPLLTNALDIIKKVQVYTFNLKSQPEEKMVGVIAQEFLDNKLDGVSLVANEAATGKNGDYMSIRESKLVYLLLKGMQEQQEQIEQLQKRITELESK